MLSCNLERRAPSDHSGRPRDSGHPTLMRRTPSAPAARLTAPSSARHTQPAGNGLLVVEVVLPEPLLQSLLLGRDLVAVDEPDEAGQRDQRGRAPARDRVREGQMSSLGSSAAGSRRSIGKCDREGVRHRPQAPTENTRGMIAGDRSSILRQEALLFWPLCIAFACSMGRLDARC